MRTGRRIPRLAVALAGLGLLLAAGAPPAAARTDRPAATLLLPYFEVDLDREDGPTTRFIINNASAAPALARVTLWTDLAVPVFAFNVFLTGYDVQRVDLRDVLEGRLPGTAGPPDPACDAPPLSGASLTALRNALRGQASATFGGQCVGQALGDGRARGYVTVDSMNACVPGFPGSPGYFTSGGAGAASNDNTLWGHYTLADRSRDGPLAAGGPLVHIPADSSLNSPGDYTFFGRVVNFTAADNRRPLATTFAVPYFQPRPGGAAGRATGASGIPYTAGTDLLVWRDVRAPAVPFACGSAPPWFPLGQIQIVAFDEEENPAEVAVGLTPFPAATQRVPVGSPPLGVPFDAGWLYLNLNTTVTGAPPGPSDVQGWVEVLHDPGGRLNVLQRPAHLDAAGP